MDLWVVAAAAGVAKYLSMDREGEGEGSSQSFSGSSTCDKSQPWPLLQQLRERACPLQRLSRRQLRGKGTSRREEVSSDIHSRLSDANGSAGASATEVASTSGLGGEASVNLRVYDEYNILSVSSLSSGLSGNNTYQEKADGIRGKSEVCDKPGDFLSSEPSTGERGCYHQYGRGRSRSSLRSRWPRGYSIKPLSSLESCLMAQLYKEHVEMDEYIFNPPPSPTAATLRPLFITDGKQIISKASSDSYRVRFGSVENKVHRGDEYAEKATVLGVPPLPETVSVEFLEKLKQKGGKGCLGRSRSSNMRVSPKNFQSQGSPNGMLLFFIGIALGVVSMVMANKREVDKLNELLQQTENLVQDLQEELEMKDSLIVRELANDGYESQQKNDFSIHHEPLAPFSPPKLTELTNCDSKELYGQKEDEKPDSMSKIEAELEAELERLELNMCSSSVQRKLSSLLELDSDFETDIVQGELRADMIKRGDRGQDDSDEDVSRTSTPPTHTANYAIPPQELSLRLHEVLQARLEERIMELETALQQSQQRMHLLESVGVNSQRDFSNGEIGSSSTHGSPTMMEDSDDIARPLVLNLAGGALDAYNEAYEELMMIPVPDEENRRSTISNNNNIYQQGLHPLNQSYHQNGGGKNGSLTHLKVIEDEQSRNMVLDEASICVEQVSRSPGLSETGQVEDEEDEMEKLLIKQILEKTKQRSPAVFNIQKMLCSMDERTSFERR